jgi:hypothetical protein
MELHTGTIISGSAPGATIMTIPFSGTVDASNTLSAAGSFSRPPVSNFNNAAENTQLTLRLGFQSTGVLTGNWSITRQYGTFRELDTTEQFDGSIP